MNSLLKFFGIIYSFVLLEVFILPKNDSMNGFYFGSSFNIDLFLSLSEDTAIAEWFYVEVSPRESFCDTLVRTDKNKNEWKGKNSVVLKHKYQLYFETKKPYSFNKSMRIKLIKDNDDIKKRTYSTYQNRVILNKAFSFYIDTAKMTSREYETRLLWKQLIQTYKLNEKANLLPHHEFIEEFRKFKTELELKLLYKEKVSPR